MNGVKHWMLVVVFSLVAGRVFAQPPSNLPAVEAAGLSTVYVIDDTGHETKGNLLHLDAASVVLLVNGVERRFEVPHVKEIDKRGDSLKNGFITGAVVGALSGLLVAGLSDCGADHPSGSCPGARVGYFLVSTGVYAAIGTGIDALIPGRTVLYKALPIASTAGAQSPVSSRRLAMNVSFRW